MSGSLTGGWRGKRSRHSRRMRNRYVYVPGKRPMAPLGHNEVNTWELIQHKDVIFYQYRKSHCEDNTVLRPSYLHNGISYTGKAVSFS